MPMAKAAWDVAGWLTRRTTPAGEGAAARRQGRAKRLAKPSSPRRERRRSRVGRITGWSREVGRRREGGGGARCSEEAG